MLRFDRRDNVQTPRRSSSQSQPKLQSCPNFPGCLRHPRAMPATRPDRSKTSWSACSGRRCAIPTDAAHPPAAPDSQAPAVSTVTYGSTSPVFPLGTHAANILGQRRITCLKEHCLPALSDSAPGLRASGRCVAADGPRPASSSVGSTLSGRLYVQHLVGMRQPNRSMLTRRVLRLLRARSLRRNRLAHVAAKCCALGARSARPKRYLGVFPHDLLRRLVLAHSQERRLPHQFIGRPRREANLHHHLWRHPTRAFPGICRSRFKRLVSRRPSSVTKHAVRLL